MKPLCWEASRVFSGHWFFKQPLSIYGLPSRPITRAKGVFSLYALIKRYGKWLAIPTILGATTLLADGIITPPISVASAVEGLEMIRPGLPTVPIVIAILSALFFFQRFGTQKVGVAFGP